MGWAATSMLFRRERRRKHNTGENDLFTNSKKGEAAGAFALVGKSPDPTISLFP